MLDVPFLGSAAVSRGLITEYQLRTRYRAIHRNVYVPTNFVMTAESRARAAWLWSGADADVIIGRVTEKLRAAGCPI